MNDLISLLVVIGFFLVAAGLPVYFAWRAYRSDRDQKEFGKLWLDVGRQIEADRQAYLETQKEEERRRQGPCA